MYTVLKRTLDIILALAGIGVFALPFAGLLLVNTLVFKGRPWFVQKRIGINGQPFALVKLRSMQPGTGADQHRLNTWGNFLRKSKLDELPQLWLLLTGTLSAVGPRPLLPEYMPHYTPLQQTRHQVKPGLTGLVQIHGGNALPWSKRLAADAVYVQRRSFLFDLYIMAATLPALWQQKAPHFSAPMPQTTKPLATTL